jgi:hypothetical protein
MVPTMPHPLLVLVLLVLSCLLLLAACIAHGTALKHGLCITAIILVREGDDTRACCKAVKALVHLVQAVVKVTRAMVKVKPVLVEATLAVLEAKPIPTKAVGCCWVEATQPSAIAAQPPAIASRAPTKHAHTTCQEGATAWHHGGHAHTLVLLWRCCWLQFHPLQAIAGP